MNATTKIIWGVVINISAVFLLFLGIGLTSTVIGACVGVPMIAGAIALFVWGIRWTVQGQTQKTRDAIAAGVAKGIERSQAGREQRGGDAANSKPEDPVDYSTKG